MTVTIPARNFCRLVDRVVAIVPTDVDDEVPILRHVHVWTDGKHLLMEASDRLRLIRTRATVDTDDTALDVILRVEAITAARRLIPDPVPVAEADWEDDEAWIGSEDPAKEWTVGLDADGERIHITIHGDTAVTVSDETRPRSEWPNLDALWARTHVAVGDAPTYYNPQLLAGLLAVEDTEPATIWPSGDEHRPTVVALGSETVALIMPMVLGAPDVIDPVPDPRDGWPGLLADDREEGQA